jgi:nucleoside-diphosphate-sugar epimerase
MTRKRILVLGGTAWLGREIARTAVSRGHEVTCVARGESGEVPDGATLVRANRDLDNGLAAVAAAAGTGTGAGTETGTGTTTATTAATATGNWDAVIDVSRQPGQVRRAVRDLAASGLYIFVSTGNVYAEHNLAEGATGADEDAPLLDPLDADVMESMADYGRAKVACEREVRNGFGPERFLIARSGLIGGPGDVSGRTGYWPVRFAHPSGAGGTVLVPADRKLSTQVIDVRDLASWLVSAADGDAGSDAGGDTGSDARSDAGGDSRSDAGSDADRATGGAHIGARGIMNAMGDRVTLGDHLAAARAAAGHTGPLAAADTEWLGRHGVEEFAGPKSLPLWLSDPDWRGFMARSNARAKAAGLTLRPLAETLSDVLAWELEVGLDQPHGAGLTAAAERELLEELSADAAPTAPTAG